jgi:hypothetical protein
MLSHSCTYHNPFFQVEAAIAPLNTHLVGLQSTINTLVIRMSDHNPAVSPEDNEEFEPVAASSSGNGHGRTRRHHHVDGNRGIPSSSSPSGNSYGPARRQQTRIKKPSPTVALLGTESNAFNVCPAFTVVCYH